MDAMGFFFVGDFLWIRPWQTTIFHHHLGNISDFFQPPNSDFFQPPNSRNTVANPSFGGFDPSWFLGEKIGVSNERNDSHGKRGTISLQKKGILAVRNSRVLIVVLL